jgi:hypothetical protein
VDYFDIPVAAVNENDEEQDQAFGHSDDLVTLFALTPNEVVLPSHVMRIVEDFLRCLERDSMNPLVPFGFGQGPRESRFHITILYLSATPEDVYASVVCPHSPAVLLSDVRTGESNSIHGSDRELHEDILGEPTKQSGDERRARPRRSRRQG